jgi:hypothetical protein
MSITSLKHYRWHWVDAPTGSGYGRFNKVWIEPDGTLYNPNGYPEELARAAALKQDEEEAKRLSVAAKAAAITRRERMEKRVYKVAQRIVEANRIGQRSHCYICGKYLSDPTSIGHGIGSECWERVLRAVTELQQQRLGSPA